MNMQYDSVQLLINIHEDPLMGPCLELWEYDPNTSYLIRKADDTSVDNLPLSLKQAATEALKVLYKCQEPIIVKKYGNRKLNSLEKLVKDEVMSKIVRTYLERHWQKAMDILLDHHCPLTYNMKRNSKIDDHMINTSLRHDVQPKFIFKNTNQGLEYILSLRIGDSELSLLNQTLVILSKDPARVILDNFLLNLEPIKAGFLSQFTRKPYALIKTSLVKDFFIKIIKPVSEIADISIHDYPYDEISDISKIDINFTRHLINRKFGFSLTYHYANWKVPALSKQLTKSIVNIGDDGQPRMTIIKRSIDQEKSFEKIIATAYNSEADNQGFYAFSEDIESLEEAIEFIRSTSIKLTSKKINVDLHLSSPEGYKVDLRPYNITHIVTEKIDWFDVNIAIEIEDETIDIDRLSASILAGSPYVLLKNGLYFLIPSKLRYNIESYIQFGQISNRQIRLPASRKGLLSHTNPSSESKTEHEQIPDNGKYDLKQLKGITLRDYQRDGLLWLLDKYEKEHGAILADDMGLGKTVQIISMIAMLTHGSTSNKAIKQQVKKPIQLSLFDQLDTVDTTANNFNNKILIVSPSSVVYNWREEFKKFLPQRQTIDYRGQQRSEYLKSWDDTGIFLTSYGTMRQDAEILKDYEWDIVILDEAQAVSNDMTATHAAAKGLDSKLFIALTGTPIENSLMDLWSIMNVVQENLLPEKEAFELIIKSTDGNVLSPALKAILYPFVLKRRKEDVLKDLPDLDIITKTVEMTEGQTTVYEKELNKARSLILKMKESGKAVKRTPEVLTQLMKLRQVANHPDLIDQNAQLESGKFNFIKDQLLTLHHSNTKSIIFSSFQKHLNLVSAFLNEEGISHEWLTGKMTARQREKSIQKFENSQTPFILITLKAGSTGINLTSASYVLILDPWWNPAAELQAIARAHRIGQKNKVTAFKIISKDTIEEKILTLQSKKQALYDDFFDTTYENEIQGQDLEYLLS